MNELFLIVLMAFGSIAAVIGVVILRGWVLSILWGWFAVPLGSPEIGIAQAIGIALVASLLTYQYASTDKDETWQPVVCSMLAPPLSLLIGWIARGWM